MNLNLSALGHLPLPVNRDWSPFLFFNFMFTIEKNISSNRKWRMVLTNNYKSSLANSEYSVLSCHRNFFFI